MSKALRTGVRDHKNKNLLQLLVLSSTRLQDNTTEKRSLLLKGYKTSFSATLLPKCAPRLDQNRISQLTISGQITTTLPPMMEKAVVADSLGQVQRADQRGPLLMALPSEIRCKIFRYLLSTRYTKRSLGYYDDVSIH